ncbi:MAG: 2-phosphosulfolactate phosphatase [Chitinophagaceae bacterium]|nr:2-phosphosulfolactate phosphatase [Chitinophagaceae bacterium]
MPSIITCLSPALLHLEEVNKRNVVIIDVLRATSTIATALFNGAKAIVPVDNVAECIRIGKQIDGITAGERDGKIADGLEYGNSPFEYNPEFIKDKVLVLTTTNGTKLLHMALDKSAREIVTGSFPNLSAVCEHMLQKKEDVILACAGWKDRVNIEDSLFAGAVINRLKDSFDIEGDSSHVAHNLYILAQKNLYEFMKKHNASHYHRLTNFGLEKDIRYCLSTDVANVLPVYIEGKLVTA